MNNNTSHRNTHILYVCNCGVDSEVAGRLSPATWRGKQKVLGVIVRGLTMKMMLIIRCGRAVKSCLCSPFDGTVLMLIVQWSNN